MTLDRIPTLPLASRVAHYDGRGIRLLQDFDASLFSIPDPQAIWVGPPSAAELPRVLTWFDSDEARRTRSGLGLYGETITDETMRQLRRGSFTSLLLHECSRVSSLEQVAQLGLTQLALVNCPAITSGLNLFDPMTVVRLWICDCPQLTTRSLRSLHNWRALELLDLQGSNVSPDLIRWLAALSHVSHLDLSRAEEVSELGRGDESGDLGSALRELERLPRLQRLGLRRTRIGDGLLRHLGRVRALRRLDLSEGYVAAPPSSFRRLYRLEHLELRGLRPRGRVDWIYGVAALQELQSLDIRDNTLSSGDLQPLREALPRARILHDELADPAGPAPPGRSAPSAIGAVRADSVGQNEYGSTTAGPILETVTDETQVSWAARRRAGEPAWPDESVRIQDLHQVVLDRRNRPCGFVKRADMRKVVRHADPSTVLAALDRGQPCCRVLTALGLLPEFVQRHDPRGTGLTNAVMKRLETLFEDQRAEVWTWGNPDQSTTFVIGAMAMRACVDLLRWRRRSRHGGSRERDTAESVLIARIIRTALVLDPGTVHLITSYVVETSGLPGGEEQLRKFVARIEDAIYDGGRPARLRFQGVAALERLNLLLPPTVRSATQAALSRVVQLLVNAIADAGADPWFRREARLKLAVLAPEALAHLQQAGAVAKHDLPRFGSVIRAQGGIHFAHAVAAATEVEASTVIEALRSSDLARIFSALAVAPYVGSREEAHALGLGLAALVGRPDRHTPEPGKTSERLGQLAAERLITLMRSRDLDPGELVQRAIDAAIRHPLRDFTPPPGLLSIVLSISPEDAGAHALIRARFGNRKLTAEARFALYLTSSALRREVGLAPLLDENEDPDLRAMIGTTGGLYQVELAAHADTRAIPWRSLRLLPVSKPPDAVPLEWLAETLRLSRHSLPAGAAVQALVGRLLRDSATPEELARGAEVLRGLAVTPPLRQLLDDSDPARAQCRRAAARWLALLGEAQDEERLAAHMVAEGAWYTQEQLQVLHTTAERLIAALPSDSVADQATCDLAALISLGFGAERCRRIEARAFVLLARRHLTAQRRTMAMRAAAYAAQLDPQNAVAASLVGELSSG